MLLALYFNVLPRRSLSVFCEEKAARFLMRLTILLTEQHAYYFKYLR